MQGKDRWDRSSKLLEPLDLAEEVASVSKSCAQEDLGVGGDIYLRQEEDMRMKGNLLEVKQAIFRKMPNVSGPGLLSENLEGIDLSRVRSDLVDASFGGFAQKVKP